jgi:hypothetical protein
LVDEPAVAAERITLACALYLTMTRAPVGSSSTDAWLVPPGGAALALWAESGHESVVADRAAAANISRSRVSLGLFIESPDDGRWRNGGFVRQ